MNISGKAKAVQGTKLDWHGKDVIGFPTESGNGIVTGKFAGYVVYFQGLVPHKVRGGEIVMQTVPATAKVRVELATYFQRQGFILQWVDTMRGAAQVLFALGEGASERHDKLLSILRDESGKDGCVSKWHDIIDAPIPRGMARPHTNAPLPGDASPALKRRILDTKRGDTPYKTGSGWVMPREVQREHAKRCASRDRKVQSAMAEYAKRFGWTKVDDEGVETFDAPLATTDIPASVVTEIHETNPIPTLD